LQDILKNGVFVLLIDRLGSHDWRLQEAETLAAHIDATDLKPTGDNHEELMQEDGIGILGGETSRASMTRQRVWEPMRLLLLTFVQA